MILTRLEVQVLDKLRDHVDLRDGWWGSVYLDNCGFDRSALGALGSLEKRGLYEPHSDAEHVGIWGNVKLLEWADPQV